MTNVRMLSLHACSSTCNHAWRTSALHCPEHAVRTHYQQHMGQAASQIPNAKLELKRCTQGYIRHGRVASQGADLTLLNLPQDPTPLTSLHSARDATII